MILQYLLNTYVLYIIRGGGFYEALKFYRYHDANVYDAAPGLLYHAILHV